MIDDVNVLHQKCTIIGVNSQARQHAVSIDGDHFVSKFGINLFRNFKQLQSKRTYRGKISKLNLKFAYPIITESSKILLSRVWMSSFFLARIST